MKRLIWLASYPKSGNTWVRLFLTHLLRPSLPEVDLNDIDATPIISSAGFLESALGLEVDCLTPEEIEILLPQVARFHAERSSERSIHKIHDARLPNSLGEFVADTASTRKIVYLVRNPLDVCVSFAHFFGAAEMSAAVAALADESKTISATRMRFPAQFPQKISSWTVHTRSWTQGHQIPTIIIRYEDMVSQPHIEFSRLAAALEIDVTREQIEAAQAKCAFHKLKALELQHGFRERPPTAKAFFRSGQVGSWRNELTKEQAQRVVQDHFSMMRFFGYVDENGDPNL